MPTDEAIATPPDDIIRAFICDLDDERAMVHINRTNALGAYDTTSYGTESRKLIADALRKTLGGN
jgi:hypothetical protein